MGFSITFAPSLILNDKIHKNFENWDCIF